MSLISWVLIALLVVVLMLVFKAKEVRHKMGFLIVTIICLFLIFSVVQVYTSHKIDLTTFDGILQAGKVYLSWMGGLFDNIKQTTSYVIGQDWSMNKTLNKIK